MFDRLWYTPHHPLRWVLWPLSGLYWLITQCRKHLIKPQSVSVPVIVVGNISVGGTGKTPCVIWLADYLKAQGHRVGIISRGYGGTASSDTPVLVLPQSDPAQVGDEPLLMAIRTQTPVAICKQRVKAANYLINQHQCTVIISDDGLQHIALARDIEIVVVDAKRQFGNGMLLPAGPLRETVARLKIVDFMLSQGGDMANATTMVYKALPLQSLQESTQAAPENTAIHAVAGIGNPQKFFDSLSAQGFECIEHAFADHHSFCAQDFGGLSDLPIVMTEKDAVKCQQLNIPNAWYLPIDAQLPEMFGENVLQKLKNLHRK